MCPHPRRDRGVCSDGPMGPWTAWQLAAPGWLCTFLKKDYLHSDSEPASLFLPGILGKERADKQGTVVLYMLPAQCAFSYAAERRR